MFTIKAYAKINLFLNVAGKRNDGYHNLEMVNAKIDLADILSFEEIQNQSTVKIQSNDKFLEKEGNLLHRVAKYMMEYYAVGKSVLITVEKIIPPGAGLAGNSTDAAAIIKGINQLFDLQLSYPQMEAIAVIFGADIPYCLYDSPAIVRGIGDQIELTKLPLENCSVLVVKPSDFVKTEDVFNLGDELGFTRFNIEPMILAINAHNQEAFLQSMHNSLESISFILSEETKLTKSLICNELGSEGVIMSGSGSTILKVVRGKMNEISDFFDKYVKKYLIFQAKLMNKE